MKFPQIKHPFRWIAIFLSATFLVIFIATGPSRRQAQAIRSLEDARVWIEYDNTERSWFLNTLTKLGLETKPDSIKSIWFLGSEEHPKEFITHLQHIYNAKDLVIKETGDIEAKTTNHFNDNDFALAKGITNLERLALKGNGFTNRSIRQINLYNQLDYLEINSNSINDDSIIELNLPNIKRLRLDSKSLTNRSLLAIKNFPKLTSLYLTNIKLSDKGLIALTSAKNLIGLSLTDIKVNGTGFKQLTPLTQLRGISLINCPISDSGFEAIYQTFPNIESLELNNVNISDSCLQHLSKLTQLQSVYISNSNIYGETFQPINNPSLSQVTSLKLYDCPINDNGIKAIATSFPNLEELILDHPNITDHGLRHLSTMKKLDLLLINNSGISGSGFEYLTKLPIKNLELTGSSITPTALKHINNFPEIENLYLKETPVQDESIISKYIQKKSISVFTDYITK